MSLSLVPPRKKATRPRPKKASFWDRLSSSFAIDVGHDEPKQDKDFLSFQPLKPPPGIVPDGGAIAMDKTIEWARDDAIEWAGGLGWGGEFLEEGLTFLGFPVLSLLAQRPEYRRISETIAVEMTRKWIKIQAGSGRDKNDKIEKINKELERIRARDAFRIAAEKDGFFGRMHLFLDFDNGDDHLEMTTPIGDGRDKVSRAKVGKDNPLKGIKCIEPLWVYPTGYNSSNPLSKDWYAPTSWFVQGIKVDKSRMMTFVGREVPDMLKPAYGFGGLALSQMAKPYVDNWIRTRQSVADLLSSFSVSGLKMNLAEALMAQGDKLIKRVDLFNRMRNNRNTMVLDTEEEFFNISTPLGTLDVLQAQTQEHMSSVCGIPLVKLLGITPSGLNASSDGEIRVFYDTIHAYQEKLFRPHLTKLVDLVQLSLFGDIDEEINFVFEPLWSLDEKEMAETNRIETETDAINIEAGVLFRSEVRKRVAEDPDSRYPGLNLTADVDPPNGEDLVDLPEPSMMTGKPKFPQQNEQKGEDS